MNLPDWLKDMTDELGAGRLAGTVSRQDAVTALRDKILEKDDRPLILGVLAEFAGKALDSWHRAHQHPAAPGSLAHVQAELFPDLPARLYIRPGVTKPPIEFTAHDWDTAREMVRARTENAIDGARADRDQFERAYARVRPLLGHDATTADIAGQLLGGQAATSPSS